MCAAATGPGAASGATVSKVTFSNPICGASIPTKRSIDGREPIRPAVLPGASAVLVAGQTVPSIMDCNRQSLEFGLDDVPIDHWPLRGAIRSRRPPGRVEDIGRAKGQPHADDD